MIRGRDPDAMRPDERLAEIAGILAVAFLRLRENGLAFRGEDEALCDQVVDAGATT